MHYTLVRISQWDNLVITWTSPLYANDGWKNFFANFCGGSSSLDRRLASSQYHGEVKKHLSNLLESLELLQQSGDESDEYDAYISRSNARRYVKYSSLLLREIMACPTALVLEAQSRTKTTDQTIICLDWPA